MRVVHHNWTVFFTGPALLPRNNGLKHRSRRALRWGRRREPAAEGGRRGPQRGAADRRRAVITEPALPSLQLQKHQRSLNKMGDTETHRENLPPTAQGRSPRPSPLGRQLPQTHPLGGMRGAGGASPEGRAPRTTGSGSSAHKVALR